jgi:hypothetical protein
MYMRSNIDKDIINYEEAEELMPFTLQTITKKMENMPNAVNRSLVNSNLRLVALVFISLSRIKIWIIIVWIVFE